MPRARKPKVVDEDMSTASIVEYFARVEDPRIERSRLHPLDSVLVLTLCAVVCGAESFVAVEDFGRCREDWLRTFLDLPHGIPSHDTLGRIFAYLDPEELERVFREWTAAVSKLSKGEVVAVDGKTLRRSFRSAGSSAFVHMVSAWAAGNRVVLGQVKTDDKSNEITAIPRLLQLLNIHGCLVTIDARGCQKDIAQAAVDAKADYMLAVKGNQATLANAITGAFEQALEDPDFVNEDNYCKTENTGHGRTEIRHCWTMDVDAECGHPYDQWPGLQGIVLVEAHRTLSAKTSIERRYYITSKSGFKAADALAASRSHWGIENQLHWVLDVAFREDDCRVRAGHAAENFAVIRHFALNLLKAAPGPRGKKLGIKNKRLVAGWNDQYMLQVLGFH